MCFSLRVCVGMWSWFQFWTDAEHDLVCSLATESMKRSLASSLVVQWHLHWRHLSHQNLTSYAQTGSHLHIRRRKFDTKHPVVNSQPTQYVISLPTVHRMVACSEVTALSLYFLRKNIYNLIALHYKTI